jgi:hypothetical protein
VRIDVVVVEEEVGELHALHVRLLVNPVREHNLPLGEAALVRFSEEASSGGGGELEQPQLHAALLTCARRHAGKGGVEDADPEVEGGRVDLVELIEVCQEGRVFRQSVLGAAIRFGPPRMAETRLVVIDLVATGREEFGVRV